LGPGGGEFDGDFILAITSKFRRPPGLGPRKIKKEKKKKNKI